MADSLQKCKENYKCSEKLSDPELMLNHKWTVAASAPQPPVDVKEEHDDSYTPYNADSLQKCKENDKCSEKLRDPESMSNHKRTVAASAPQPPVVVKEENHYNYTPYNAELQCGLHSVLDIKFEPDEDTESRQKCKESPQKCKENDKCSEKLSDPELMSNHKRTVAASAPQPPVHVKEENHYNYTPYNAELQCGLHSVLDIKFEPDEDTGFASTIKPEIEEKPSLSAETQPIVIKKMNTGASSSSSKCKSEDCIEETEDNLTHKDLLNGENQENIKQDQKCHSSKQSGKGYKHKSMKSQVKEHSAARKYICDVCSYITTKKQCIICHLKKHNGEKAYDCNICKKTFRLASTLNRHIRTHTGYKPYACKFCDKKFTQSQNVKNHVRTHTGEKPFACKMCDKKFTETSSLNKHMRTHTGERPYVCRVCDKKFSFSSNLRKHTRTHIDT